MVTGEDYAGWLRVSHLVLEGLMEENGALDEHDRIDAAIALLELYANDPMLQRHSWPKRP